MFEIGFMDTSSFGQLMRYLALAPYLCEKTEECARAAYKIMICIGEDVTFEESLGRIPEEG